MKLKGSIRILGLVLVVLASSLTSYAGGRRVYLGRAHVDGARDHDNISVGRYEGRFRALQIEVRGGAIEFGRVVVHYGNGENQELEIRRRIPAGGRTREIELAGDRLIRSVEFWYGKDNWRTRPEVKLFGIR